MSSNVFQVSESLSHALCSLPTASEDCEAFHFCLQLVQQILEFKAHFAMEGLPYVKAFTPAGPMLVNTFGFLEPNYLAFSGSVDSRISTVLQPVQAACILLELPPIDHIQRSIGFCADNAKDDYLRALSHALRRE